MSHPDAALDFLVMSCGDMTFLVNRNQFTSSLFIDGVDQVSTSNSCCSGTIDYGKDKLFLFDFNRHLQNLFHFKSTQAAHLALVIPLDILSPVVRVELEKMTSDEMANMEYMALRITNQSAIEHIPLASLRPIPPLLKDAGRAGGILGLRFVSQDHIQYFIDLNIMISSMLEGKL